MVVARLHEKLFEAAARDMDRQIRLQFLDEALRPDYLRDFEGQLALMVQLAERGAEVGGRMLWAKRIVRRLMRPYVVHQAMLNRMMAERLTELHRDLMRLSGDADELRSTMREDLEHQADLLREEILATAGAQSDSTRSGVPVGEPIGPGAKLILGSVAVRRPGYVHVDPSAEGSTPLDRLPVEPGTAAEIVVANALELYPEAEVRRRLLPYWASLLRPGGRLTVVADDLDAAADRFRDGQMDADELAGLILGPGGPARRSAFTPARLARYAEEAGLADVSVADRRQRPGAGAFGFELSASRPAA